MPPTALFRLVLVGSSGLASAPGGAGLPLTTLALLGWALFSRRRVPIR
jgi:hypothetical protein